VGGGGGNDSASVAQEPTYTTSAARQRLREAETLQSNFQTIQEVETGRSAKSARQTDPLDMQVMLGLDFHAAGPSNSLERAEFEEVLVCDLCKASGLKPLSFHVQTMSPGSVVVNLLVFDDPTGGGPSPRDAGMALQSQVKDPKSTLRAGTLTRHTIAITFPSEASQKGSPTSGPGTPQDLEHEMRGRVDAEVREQHVEAEKREGERESEREKARWREERAREEETAREREMQREAEEVRRREEQRIKQEATSASERQRVAEEARGQEEKRRREQEAVRERERQRAQVLKKYFLSCCPLYCN
jgi:hypothetical protein